MTQLVETVIVFFSGLTVLKVVTESYSASWSYSEPAKRMPKVGRRAWQPTLLFLPRESHGQRSLVGYSPWGFKDWLSDSYFYFQHVTWSEVSTTSAFPIRCTLPENMGRWLSRVWESGGRNNIWSRLSMLDGNGREVKNRCSGVKLVELEMLAL